MAKIKLKRLHKIKVHKNRWLIWAIAYAIIIAIGLLGYLKISSVNFDTELTAENSFQSWRSYKDSRLGFSLRYPADWGIEADSQSTVNFLPAESNREGVAVSVFSLTAEASVRKSLKVINEKTIPVDDMVGSLILNDIGQGATESVVLVKKNGKLYVVSGANNLILKIIQTFKFL